MSEPNVDPLVNVVQGHQRITENMNFLRTVPQQIRKEGIWKELHKLEGFLKKGLDEHFRMEEESVFPMVLKRTPPQGQAEMGNLIGDLKDEHEALLQQARAIEKILEENVYPLPDPVMAQLNALLLAFSEALLRHAGTEDRKVFPTLERD